MSSTPRRLCTAASNADLAENMLEVAQEKTRFQVKFVLTNKCGQGLVNQYNLEEVKGGPVVKWSCRHSQTF